MLVFSGPGRPVMEELGRDLDIRTDLARYRVWREGRIVAEPQDIPDLWPDDLVAFVLGCSYSFEQALNEPGVRLKHSERRANSPYYLPRGHPPPPPPFPPKPTPPSPPFPA